MMRYRDEDMVKMTFNKNNNKSCSAVQFSVISERVALYRMLDFVRNAIKEINSPCLYFCRTLLLIVLSGLSPNCILNSLPVSETRYGIIDRITRLKLKGCRNTYSDEIASIFDNECSEKEMRK